MVIAELKLKCWKCGTEETIIEETEESVVDFNLNKLCPVCREGWMVKKELTISQK